MVKPNDISNLSKKWKKIILALMDDPNLKHLLLQHPEETLLKLGFKVPDNQKVKIHENSEETLHLVIPQKPKKELTDQMLSDIVAGFHYGGDN